MALSVIREEISERLLVGKDRDPVPTYKAFVRSVDVLFSALYRVYKCMETLSFDSLAETDIARRFPPINK